MNVLMISRSVYETDVRVRREAEALVLAGYQLTVIGLGESSTPTPGLRVEGLGGVAGLTARRPRSPSVAYRLARWVLLPSHRNKALQQFETAVMERFNRLAITADVVHAHDYPALGAATEIAQGGESHLIYDSHEFWPGTSRPGRPAPVSRHLEERREGRLAQKADAVLTVSLGLARLLESRHGLTNVQVVHNTFPARSELRAPLRPTGAVYAGRIGRGRDLETIVASEAWGPDLELHIIGPQDGSVALPSHAHVHQTADLDTVDDLLVNAGIALVPLTDGVLNHEVALPNKLFQAMSVGVPVIAADLPEIRRVVVAHGLGTLYRPGDSGSVTRAVNDLLSEYEAYVDNVVRARPTLDWAADEATLLRSYRSLPQ